MQSGDWGWPGDAGRLPTPPLTTRPRQAMPGLIVYLPQSAKTPARHPRGFLLGPAVGCPPAVRGGHAWIPACANDSVWCGEGFFVAHEPLCFSMTAYYKIPTPEISRARVAAALSVMAPIQSSTRRYAV